MRTVSKIILILLSPLILLSGNGIMLIQHHCRMEGETNYSFAGLLETSACCDPGSLQKSGMKKNNPVFNDPGRTCCTLHSLFLKSADFNGSDSNNLVTGTLVHAAVPACEINLVQPLFLLACNHHSYFSPPPEIPSDQSFLGVFRL
jgi:hypothetical protein